MEPEEEPFGLGCALESFTEHEEILEIITNYEKIHSNGPLSEKAFERLQLLLNQYKEQPHLIDPHLDSLLDKSIAVIRRGDVPLGIKHGIFKYLFVIFNVRGYKVVIRHLPHEVADFELVLKLLEAQDLTDVETWTTRYILLLWLSIIVMIPFHLSRFDGDETTDTVMSRVLTAIKAYLTVPDKCRDGASYLSARFITRTDVKTQHLSGFFDWCVALTKSGTNVFGKEGVLSSVAMILKHGDREDLLPFGEKLLQWTVSDEVKDQAGTNVQRLIYKIIQRIGLVFLPPILTTWRYKRGNRSLALNLAPGSLNQGDVCPLDSPVESYVPDEIEEVIDQLIQGLRSTEGVVRWSAAKGIGRVTARLPHDLADEVVGSILELFSPREGDGAWHGGCLSLAELGRRGLLLPKRLPEVVPLVLKALVYDEPRGYSSVGSHIRDAACYVCWSFARAYETQDLEPFVGQIASRLLTVTCFDREINCRRAASAAFQENVGRQSTFPHGIDILTVADFYAVSSRNNAYLAISPFIAQFDEYTIDLIEHLLERKVDHWDYVIRELTAKALHNLTGQAPDFMHGVALPALFLKAQSIDLNTRHGATLAIGEIVRKAPALNPELLAQSEALIPGYRSKFYFRGLGGELMRGACCNFIENCASARVGVERATSQAWLELLMECIAYNVPSVQNAGIKALPGFLTVYFPGDNMRDLVEKFVKEVAQATVQETRMGHVLALGALPGYILRGNLTAVLGALLKALELTPGSLKWAEARRDALKALTNVVTSLSGDIGGLLSEQLLGQIYGAFFTGLQDYTQDKRGDVGAWIREASMVGLQSLTLQVFDKSPGFLSKPLMGRVLGGIAQQAVEKIDRTRALAGRIFYALVTHTPPIPGIEGHAEILGIFEGAADLNWNSGADTFPRFVQLLRFDAYRSCVMLGLVCSVGGMTETLVRHSSQAVFELFRGLERAQMGRFCEVIYTIFEENQRVDRVTVPMLRFLEKLLSAGCVQEIGEGLDPDQFCKRVQRLILGEIAGCSDVYKLVDASKVLALFIQVKSDVARAALSQLMILLCHRQVYIRKSTAGVLYEALLLYGDATAFAENLSEIMQILSYTNWEEPISNVKPIRDHICGLLKVPVPVPKKVQR